MIIIRDYQEADRDAAIGLFLELNRHEAEITGDRRTDVDGAIVCVDDMKTDVARGGAIRVAEWDGTVAGLLVWRVSDPAPYVEPALRQHGIVQDLVVSAVHRGKGIGGALLADAERLTRDAGLPRIALTMLAGNDQAGRVYAKAGYRAYAEVMVKPLD
jgi:GNAT superfamily N-acetyltransferase